jgi:hypothetical protein
MARKFQIIVSGGVHLATVSESSVMLALLIFVFNAP